MKLIDNKNDKETNFKFENKDAQRQYIETCLELWGCVPCDVRWATETSLYKNKIIEKCEHKLHNSGLGEFSFIDYFGEPDMFFYEEPNQPGTGFYTTGKCTKCGKILIEKPQ